MVFKYNSVSMPLGLPLALISNHSRDFNLNNEVRAQMTVYVFVDLKMTNS